MVQFFILGTNNKRTCEATDSHKAAQILRLMFHNSKGYVVENNKIAFAQNMTIDEAALEHGLKVAAPVQSMEVLPVAPKPNGKPKKAAVTAKPKKATIKSKVVVKPKKKAPAKKAAVKVKAKPKAKVKAAKKPVKKPAPKSKANGKAKKR